MRKNLLASLMFLCLSGCAKTELLNAPELKVVVKAESKPHKPQTSEEPDTTKVDTTRVSIGFNPSVEDWDEKNITNL